MKSPIKSYALPSKCDDETSKNRREVDCFKKNEIEKKKQSNKNPNGLEKENSVKKKGNGDSETLPKKKEQKQRKNRDGRRFDGVEKRNSVKQPGNGRRRRLKIAEPSRAIIRSN